MYRTSYCTYHFSIAQHHSLWQLIGLARDACRRRVLFDCGRLFGSHQMDIVATLLDGNLLLAICFPGSFPGEEWILPGLALGPDVKEVLHMS